ncbi:unnamed protein product [Parascedosporium putredinis]|uniref:Uncharacterized protein n=1 Tax=Parascedosporium putredinis TaxID=1442378 RepID=A0A9P1HAL2_9PEZI|nr:unnamed protein product [Parascedosporium putredinis]CAI8002836.1 unnamed protein product [Parascedosporium putredinis]
MSGKFQYTSPIMQQWQVGPVPDLTYFNSNTHQNDMHAPPHTYQPQDMRGRNERMDFPVRLLPVPLNPNNNNRLPLLPQAADATSALSPHGVTGDLGTSNPSHVSYGSSPARTPGAPTQPVVDNVAPAPAPPR